MESFEDFIELFFSNPITQKGVKALRRLGIVSAQVIKMCHPKYKGYRNFIHPAVFIKDSFDIWIEELNKRMLDPLRRNPELEIRGSYNARNPL